MTTNAPELTDEQVNEFRRMPGSFADMVRAIYAAGRSSPISGSQQMGAEAIAHRVIGEGGLPYTDWIDGDTANEPAFPNSWVQRAYAAPQPTPPAQPVIDARSIAIGIVGKHFAHQCCPVSLLDVEKIVEETIESCRQPVEEVRNAALEEAARICDAMKPVGGRLWDEKQHATFNALSDAAKNIRALKSTPTAPQDTPAQSEVAELRRPAEHTIFYLQRRSMLPVWENETPGHKDVAGALACVQYTKSTKERPLRILEVSRRVVMDQAEIDAAIAAAQKETK